MKCAYYLNDSDNITGWWFSDGGSTEEEGDFVCSDCFVTRKVRNMHKEKD